MPVNGRLTAPPQIEAELVTNSVESRTPAIARNAFVASGSKLDFISLDRCSQLRFPRTAARIRAGELAVGKSHPVFSASRFLSATTAAVLREPTAL
jgi:hypothetical protein